MSERAVPATSDCPSDQQLLRLIAGELDESDRDAVETHLDSCAACQNHIAAMCECQEAQGWREAHRAKERPDERAKAFLQRLKAQCPRAVASILFPGLATDESPLGRLETYCILRELGQGGMGAVFLARDSHLGNLVTIKVLKPELAASDRDRERFFREGRAAAAVKDDHVVAVYRADTAVDFPLPYLVMEYIDGGSLADRLARHGALPPDEVALLTRQVALGLTAAHRKGLVHRDVKPSNIMLDADSGRAKVTDFGLARVLDAQSQQITQQGSVVGTPAYMSPEHILEPEKVDARSDVYGLGAVMYEMLTGVRAFSGTPHMVLMQTIHDDPRAPRKLNDAVAADLETICLKCLRKSPEDRYTSANELADDLQRFLRDEPIQARPVGSWERLVMWRRRYPQIAALLAGIASLLVLITVVSTTAAVLVTRSWNEERQARAAEAAARVEEASAREDADRRARQARRAVDEMYTQVAEDWLKDQPRMQSLQREFLLKALKFYEEFAREQSDDIEIQRQAAVAHRRVGDIHYTFGDYDQAEAAYNRAASGLEQLIARADSPHDRKELAVTQMNRALLLATVPRAEESMQAYTAAETLLAELVAEDEAEPEYRELLGHCLSGYSQVQKGQGMPEDAVASCRRAADLQRRLLDDFPEETRYRGDLATSLVHLGLSLEHLGRYDEALQAVREGIALESSLLEEFPTNPDYRFDVGNSYTHLSRLQEQLGDYREALGTLQQVEQMQTELAADFPDVVRYRQDVGGTLSSLAGLLANLGDLKQAEAKYRGAIDVYRALSQEFPESADHRMNQAGISNNLCGLLARTGRAEEACNVYAEAVRIQEEIVEQFPDDIGFHVGLAISCNNFGNLLEDLGRADAGEQRLAQAVEIYGGLADRVPNNVFLRRNLYSSTSNLARILATNGKFDEAEDAFRQAIAGQAALAEQNPEMPEFASELAHTYNNLGTLLDDLQRHPEAEEAFREALRVRDRLAASFPEVAEFRRDLAASHNNLGVFYDSIDRHDQARQPLETGLQLREALAADQSANLQYAIDLSGSYGNLGRHFRQTGDAPAAITWFDRAIQSVRQVLETEPRQQEAREVLRNALASRALALDALDRSAEALTELDKALELTQGETEMNRIAVHRARILLNLKRYEEALAHVDAAAQSTALTADRAYELACVLSLLSAATAGSSETAEAGHEDRIEQLQSRAVQLVQRSRELGLFALPAARQKLREDPELDALRSRADFAELLDEQAAQ